VLRKLTVNKAIVYAVDAFIIYWILALFIPAFILRDVFNSISFGCAVIITITWLPAAFQAVKNEAKSGEWQLILGITVLWFTVMVQRLYAIAYNYMGQPESWLHSPITGFWPYCYMACGLLFLMAPGFVAGEVISRRRTLNYIIGALVIGAFLSGVLLGTSISSN